MKDCETLLRRRDKVVFIAIGSGSRVGALPFPELDPISIPPNQLDDVLRWLPPGKSVVLCGEVDLCRSTIGLSEDSAGAPIYVLNSGPAQVRAG